MSEPGRTVTCPNCGTRYFLPESLMGVGGARVRCPHCAGMFAVSREGRPAAVAPEAAAPPADADAPPPAPIAPADAFAGAPEEERAPDHLARRLLDAMAEGRGAEIRQAAAEGRLFAAYGPEIMEVYDAYRREVGRDADPAPFRDALRERWGVEMLPGETE